MLKAWLTRMVLLGSGGAVTCVGLGAYENRRKNYWGRKHRQQDEVRNQEGSEKEQVGITYNDVRTA